MAQEHNAPEHNFDLDAYRSLYDENLRHTIDNTRYIFEVAHAILDSCFDRWRNHVRRGRPGVKWIDSAIAAIDHIEILAVRCEGLHQPDQRERLLTQALMLFNLICDLVAHQAGHAHAQPQWEELKQARADLRSTMNSASRQLEGR